MPRLAYWLEGEVSWGIAAARVLLQAFAQDVLWVSTQSQLPNALPATKVKSVLGQSYQAIVFDAHSGFDVNALALVVGTLREGGVLLLLTPTNWAQFRDVYLQRFVPYAFRAPQHRRFIQRFIRCMQQSTSWYRYSMPDTPHTPLVPPPELIATDLVLNPEQQQALQALQAYQGVSLLLADRGRGKSTLLGALAAQYCQQQYTVCITAPSRHTAERLMAELVRCFPLHQVLFIAPDALLQTLPEADVLLIDEAAAIPLPLLLRMVQHYPRSIFSTTVQGYEGSGRGFLLKFRQQLSNTIGQWQTVTLHQPIRWLGEDALEYFFQQALLLPSMDNEDALETVAHTSCTELKPSELDYRHITQAQLLANEDLLQQLFTLLLAAHYQTRPSDLMQMLDAPNLSIHVLAHQKTIIAVALLSREGGLSVALTEQIYTGKRRPQGHLLPQTLTWHAQIAEAAQLKCERIMRIAVAEPWQGKGVGSQLLHYLCEYAAKTVDYIGVSYAASPTLQYFWERSGFITLRVGFKRDRASGYFSVVQALPFSMAAQALLQQASHRPPNAT